MVTGIVPIVLEDLISDLKPVNMTWFQNVSCASGFRDHDVDSLRDCVHGAKPFETDQEKEQVRIGMTRYGNAQVNLALFQSRGTACRSNFVERKNMDLSQCVS